MPRVLLEITVTPGAPLPINKLFLNRVVRLRTGADSMPLVVATKTSTAIFANVPPGTYEVLIQDMADDATLLGTPVTGTLVVGTAAPPPGGTYAASAGFTSQVLA